MLVDVYNPCLGVTCNHNGRCVSPDGAFSCHCTPSHTGDLCQTGTLI